MVQANLDLNALADKGTQDEIYLIKQHAAPLASTLKAIGDVDDAATLGKTIVFDVLNGLASQALEALRAHQPVDFKINGNSQGDKLLERIGVIDGIDDPQEILDGFVSMLEATPKAQLKQLAASVKTSPLKGGVNIGDLQRQLSDKQDALDNATQALAYVKPVFDALDKEKDLKVRGALRDNAVAAASGAAPSTSVAGVPQDEHDKVVKKADESDKALKAALKLLKFLRTKSAHNALLKRIEIRVKDTELDAEDKVVWDSVKAP